VAILAQQPIEVVQRGLPGQDELGARLLTAHVGNLDYTTLYIPNGKYVGHEDFPRKLAWLDALADHIAAAHDPSRPAVVCGDFNLCPQPIDSWNEGLLHGAIFHTDEERSRFQRLLDWGLVDVYRRLRPDTQAFSWWDYRAGNFHKGIGMRIDLVLGSPAVRDRVSWALIDRNARKGKQPSDHAPLVMELG
jgi:exodeoxyribonuclease-3